MRISDWSSDVCSSDLVCSVDSFGMKEYAIRIWLQPDRLASAGLTPMDVASAVREQNSQFSTGRIGEEPMPRIVDETISITTQGRLSDPKEFEQIILRAERGGKIIRLGDVEIGRAHV